jgi:hypothetical protein
VTSMRPVPGTYPVSQSFNGSFSTQFSGGSAHGAIDFATPTGTPVVAPDDGTIVFASWAWDLPGGTNDWAARWFQLKPAVGNTSGGGGIMTVLRNTAGSHWIFAHLSSNDEAPVGKRVKRGDIIGKTGNTGTSTGPHLHLALVPPNPNWSNGTYGSIDPAPWLTIPYAPNMYTSWTGKATTGTGAASKAGVTTLPRYTLDERPSKNYYTPAQARSEWGRERKITGVTIHWWNTPKLAGTHDSTAAYLAREGGDTSAHYVVSKGRVTRLVDPKNAAWHAYPAGNAATIGIECDPRDIPGTLPTIAALIQDLERTYGSLRIYRHKDWVATSCPGDYSDQVQALVQLVNNGQKATATSTDWFTMATEAQLRKIVREEISGTINHLTAEVDDRGRKIMGRLRRAAGEGVAAIKIPGLGTAEGDMSFKQSKRHERDERGKTIAARAEVSEALKVIAASQSQVLARLEALERDNNITKESI